MQDINPRILVISSISPSVGPAKTGVQIYEALRQKGLAVDFMTKYPEPDHPEYLWVLEKKSLRNYVCRIITRLRWALVGGKAKEAGHFFSYVYEKWPPIPSKLVVNAIKKQYDLVIISFWQGLLSFETVERIYDKLKCQIQFAVVDFSHMSGGCHFPNNCQRYKTGCGKCPAFHSKKENDFTAQNVRYRKRFYEKVKPIIGGNSYMKQFYDQSYLLKDVRQCIGMQPIIDTNVFHPIDNSILRKKYKIPDCKEFILLFGCQRLDDERKGINYLIESFRILYKNLQQESYKVLVMAVGKNFDMIKAKIPFDSISFGYVPMEKLPELYSLATCFVCPSINDAGPMMVNQSLCCGTPVVGFDMGAVKEVVKNRGTGICVPIRDSEALAEGISNVIKMPKNEYERMSANARRIALNTSSYGVHADHVLEVYKMYKKEEYIC